MIGIVVNSNKIGTSEVAETLSGELNTRKVLFSFFEEAGEARKTPEPLSCLISIGGDGTFLRAAEVAAELDVPIFGVNMGRIGFLTEVVPEKIPEAAEKLLRGDYTVEKRLLLDCSINGVKERTCLNDVLVSKSSFSGTTEVEVFCGRHRIGDAFCDGMLVSTPTGSTAYNLSAGGPVLYPNVDAMAVTPVCSHTVYFKPFVVSPDTELRILMRAEGSVAADGDRLASLQSGDTVSVIRSDRILKLIRFGETDVMNLIHEKLC